MSDQEKEELTKALHKMRIAVRCLAIEIPELVYRDISAIFGDLDTKIQFLLKES